MPVGSQNDRHGGNQTCTGQNLDPALASDVSMNAVVHNPAFALRFYSKPLRESRLLGIQERLGEGNLMIAGEEVKFAHCAGIEHFFEKDVNSRGK